MNIILFDDPEIWQNFLPLTYTRPIGEIRIGILKISEKWQQYTWVKKSFITAGYLQEKYPYVFSSENILINSSVLPDPWLYQKIKQLEVGESLVKNNKTIALKCDAEELEDILKTTNFETITQIIYNEEITTINNLADLFLLNGDEIRKDFKLLTKNRESAEINDMPTVTYNSDDIFIESGVKIRAAVLNAENGPIYIGKNSEIQEGAMIRGPFALGEGAVVNMGCKIKGDTTIGPFCKVGGEISNSLFFGYSNKSHDGFLGNSIVGEWCNLGADTNTSNLKNNYSPIKIWSHSKHKFIDTGLQFFGMVMADHAKAGINTMFNTGTVIGVGANVFGGGFPPKFIPSFSWGGSDGLETFELEKAIELANRVMIRRGLFITDKERNILKEIFRVTVSHR